MRPIGFSTGALAQSDVRRGLALIRRHGLSVVELSALRDTELATVLNALPDLDLGGFEYVSFHAPSAFRTIPERTAADRLRTELPQAWPVVVHPDALAALAGWRAFGPRLCIENMDKRKPIGRTAAELQTVFDLYPEATLCFDIGHARQVDPTMGVAADILRRFGDRLRQVHISEVNARNRHEPISYTALEAFRSLAHLIPENVPVVSEASVEPAGVREEVRTTALALSARAGRLIAPIREVVRA
jgi:sugar phosphate isomerase/epimerase